MPHAAGDVPTRVLWLPRGGGLDFYAREPDGFADVLFGSLRVQVRDDEVRVATDQFVLPVSYAAPVARGWVFVGEDGICAASRSFLGPLTRVGDFPDFHREFGYRGSDNRQRGRVALVDRDHAAWMSDGGPFVPVTALAPQRVEQIYFVSERFGGAITDGGLVYCTRDGGARWSLLANEGRGATHMNLRPEGIEVNAGDWLRLTPDCRLVDRDGEGDAPPGPQEAGYLPDEPESERWLREDGASLPWLLASADSAWIDLLNGRPRPDGTLLANTRSELRTLDAATARVLRRVGGYYEPCRIADAGHLARLDCQESGSHGAVTASTSFVDPGGARSTALDAEHLPPGLERAVPSDRVGLAVAPGACPTTVEPSPEPASFDALCQFSSSTSPGVTRPLARPGRRLLGIAGSRALLALGERALGVVDLAATGAALAVEPVFTVADDQTLAVGVGVGGFVTALTYRAHVLSGVAVGTLGRPLAAVALPPGVDRAVFADAAHGLAWSIAYDRVVRTRDGGRHWEPLALPFDGPIHLQGPEDSEPPLDPDSMHCTLDRCLIGGRIVVAGWGPPAPDAGLWLQVRPANEAPEAPPERWFTPEQMPTMRCAPDGAAAALPALPPIAAPPGRRARTSTARAIEGGMHAVLWFDERQRLRARFAWRGRDARGGFAGASAAAEVPGPLAAEAGALGAVELRALAVGRTGAWVELHSAAMNSSVLLRLRAGGAPERVGSGSPVLDPHVVLRSRGASFTAMLPAAAGDSGGGARIVDLTEGNGPVAARWLSFPRWSERSRAEQEARDREPGPHSWLPMALAERGDVRGAALLVHGAPARFAVYPVAPSPDAAPVFAPYNARGNLRPCAAAPAPDAWTLSLDAGDASWVSPSLPDARTLVVVEAGAEGVCLRAVDQVGRDAAWSVAASDGGVMRGTRVSADAARPLRCEVR